MSELKRISSWVSVRHVCSFGWCPDGLTLCSFFQKVTYILFFVQFITNADIMVLTLILFVFSSLLPVGCWQKAPVHPHYKLTGLYNCFLVSYSLSVRNLAGLLFLCLLEIVHTAKFIHLLSH